MQTNWSTVQLSLRPQDEQERNIARQFATFWRPTWQVGEELGWKVSPGAIVQLYFQYNEQSAASEVFVSPTKRDRFIVRVTPKLARKKAILDALHAAAAALPHPSAVNAAIARRSGNVSVDVIEVTSSWEAVIGEDGPTADIVAKRLHAFVCPLLRAIPKN